LAWWIITVFVANLHNSANGSPRKSVSSHMKRIRGIPKEASATSALFWATCRVMHLQASKLNFALWQVLLSLVHCSLQASGDVRPNIQSQLKGAFSGYWIVRWSLTGGILDDSFWCAKQTRHMVFCLTGLSFCLAFASAKFIQLRSQKIVKCNCHPSLECL
jgi:hypothetical protein